MPSERTILYLIAAVQFVNILDFMMVMPLGPDFSKELGIPLDQLGLIGGSYTAAAAISGLAGSAILDRFDRRSVLAVAMAGLAFATALGGFAWNFQSLLAARVLAGAFGGPATAIALSIVADIVPTERRGQAMGIVMGAFSVASVLGVPAGLELAHLGGWRTPFWAVASLGGLLTLAAITRLPSLRGHLNQTHMIPMRLSALLSNKTVLVSLLASGMITISNFVIIPNISSFLQYNIGYPRDGLGTLYMVGGASSFLMLRLMGKRVDRFGSSKVFLGGTLILIGTVAMGFMLSPPILTPMLIFPLYMGGQSIRNVSLQTLTSKVPGPTERARYQSAQSAAQHLFSAAGAVIGSAMLKETETHALTGMSKVAALSICLSLSVPILVLWVDREIGKRRITAL